MNGSCLSILNSFQEALIAKILAALGPQLSSIVDNSIGEFETVTEEKVVTVKDLPAITSTFDFENYRLQAYR